MSINSVTIEGNLTDDVDLRYTPGGKAVANFSIAVNRTGKGGKQVLDGFFKVVAWEQLAENVAETAGKGQRVTVKGRLTQRSWEAEDGSKRYVVEIVAKEVNPSTRTGSAASPGKEPGEDASDEAQAAADAAHEPAAE